MLASGQAIIICKPPSRKATAAFGRNPVRLVTSILTNLKRSLQLKRGDMTSVSDLMLPARRARRNYFGDNKPYIHNSGRYVPQTGQFNDRTNVAVCDLEYAAPSTPVLIENGMIRFGSLRFEIIECRDKCFLTTPRQNRLTPDVLPWSEHLINCLALL